MSSPTAILKARAAESDVLCVTCLRPTVSGLCAQCSEKRAGKREVARGSAVAFTVETHKSNGPVSPIWRRKVTMRARSEGGPAAERGASATLSLGAGAETMSEDAMNTGFAGMVFGVGPDRESADGVDRRKSDARWAALESAVVAADEFLSANEMPADSDRVGGGVFSVKLHLRRSEPWVSRTHEISTNLNRSEMPAALRDLIDATRSVQKETMDELFDSFARSVEPLIEASSQRAPTVERAIAQRPSERAAGLVSTQEGGGAPRPQDASQHGQSGHATGSSGASAFSNGASPAPSTLAAANGTPSRAPSTSAAETGASTVRGTPNAAQGALATKSGAAPAATNGATPAQSASAAAKGGSPAPRTAGAERGVQTHSPASALDADPGAAPPIAEHPRAVEIRSLKIRPTRPGYAPFITRFTSWETPRHLPLGTLECAEVHFMTPDAQGVCSCIVGDCKRAFIMKNKRDVSKCVEHVYTHLPALPPDERDLDKLRALDAAVADSLAFGRAVGADVRRREEERRRVAGEEKNGGR
jgi:hypothetical protein